jgi:hypothetical protein
MEIILLILAVTNLAATCWFGKQLLSREDYRIEFVNIPNEYIENVYESQSEQKEDPQPEAQAPVETGAKVSYSAWENRTNIPWVESTRPPAAPVSLSKEPLARPDGFV